jgi:putative acetyltransferase
MPWLPALHSADEDRRFFADRVFQECEVLVVRREGRPVAFLALSGHMVEHLYVEPEAQRNGFGGLQLWSFQRNRRAREFYARRGFAEVRLTDGADNEEREPDVLMAWPAESRQYPSLTRESTTPEQA